MKPVFVAIGGGSGSGKSTLCARLQEDLGKDMVEVIHLDTYFFPNAGTNNRPESIDIDRAKADLEAIADGRSVTVTSRGREYNYQPRPIVIVEGHLVLTFPEILELFDLTVYIDMEAQERIMRRIERNVAAGRELAEITAWYRKDAQGNHWKFIEPTKQDADIIIWGECTPRRLRVLRKLLLSFVQE